MCIGNWTALCLSFEYAEPSELNVGWQRCVGTILRFCVEQVWMYALPVGVWINRYMDIHYAETKPNHLYLATSSKDYT